AVDLAGDELRGADEGVVGGLGDDELAQRQPLPLGAFAQAAGVRDAVDELRVVLPLAAGAVAGLAHGQRAVRVEPRELAAPHGLDPGEGRRLADLLERDLARALPRLLCGVADDE